MTGFTPELNPEKKNFFFLSKIFKVLDLIRSLMWLRAEFRSGRNDSAF